MHSTGARKLSGSTRAPSESDEHPPHGFKQLWDVENMVNMEACGEF